MNRVLTLHVWQYSLISVAFCLLSTSVLFGQGTNIQQNSIVSNDYLSYYHTIAIAEEAIVTEKYTEAIRDYQKLFAEYPYNNPIDCYIAAQLAAYTEDTSSCLHFITNGLRFGLPIQTIARNPHLTKAFAKISKHVVDSCWGIYQTNIDHSARAAMLSLIKRDQLIIHNLPEGESIYEQDGYTLKNGYRPSWDSLVEKVMALTVKYGFPAQKIVGTQNGEDSLFRIGPNAVFATYIFIHHSNAWSKVGKTLWEELLKGNITPQMYGVIYESSNGKAPYDNPIKYFASRPCQDNRCTNIVEEHLQEINTNRRNIGLGSYEVMEKKFESRNRYVKWVKKGAKTPQPYFDFECDLNFQGK